MSEEGALLTRVMALHALAYCERLFYLEEVEEIRVADDRVYAGRTLHEERSGPDPTATEHRNFDVASERLGLTGTVDAVRQREGEWVPYEHKRGRARRGTGEEPEAWPSDRLQVTAYAL
ncbi:MAG: CRISPR-associated protein Cas4, partial [Dehalococcoidia bacterium]